METALLPAPKSDFAGLDHLRYFYTGAEGPVLQAHREAFARYLENKAAGEAGRNEHEAVAASCRALLADLLGGTPDNVAILSNASEALSRAAGAIPWRRGGNVVTSTLEFPSVIQPLLGLRTRGVDVRIAAHRSWNLSVDDIAAMVDENTQAIMVSHVSYVSGHRLDLNALASVAADAGALLVVDATQSLGVVPVDGEAADIVVASSYKWLLGPHGAGVVYARDPQRLDLTATGTGWRSVPKVFLPDRFEQVHTWPTARRFELGYPSFPSLYLLQASLQYLAKYPAKLIESHVHRLGDVLIDGLNRAGHRVITPKEALDRAGTVTALTARGEELANALAARGVLAWGGDGRIRFSIHLFNDDDDVTIAIDRLLEVCP